MRCCALDVLQMVKKHAADAVDVRLVLNRDVHEMPCSMPCSRSKGMKRVKPVSCGVEMHTSLDAADLLLDVIQHRLNLGAANLGEHPVQAGRRDTRQHILVQHRQRCLRMQLWRIIHKSLQITQARHVQANGGVNSEQNCMCNQHVAVVLPCA